MSYLLPVTQIFQQFRTAPQVVQAERNAHISGGNAQLVRYADEVERERGFLGYYDSLADTTHVWPNRPALSIVDQDYTRIFVKDALLQYYFDGISSGSAVTKVAGHTNRIRSATVNFASAGSSVRNVALLRDVSPGDVARVDALDGSGDTITLWTTVKSLVGEKSASSIGAAAVETTNADATTAGVIITRLDTLENCISLVASASNYSGLASGYNVETYTVIVTQSSVDGDATTARLRVLSASGKDDQLSVTPAAFGAVTPIGTRGLEVIFDNVTAAPCISAASGLSISADDLIEGQRWQLRATAQFTPPTATSGGTYTGTVDTTYVVTVTRGGNYITGLKPQITTTTTTGVDLSPATTLNVNDTATPIGTLGVTIRLNGNLRKGDVFYIAASAGVLSAVKTIELSHTLDPAIADGDAVGLTLYIKKPSIEIPRNRTGFAPVVNWSTTTDQLTITSGMVGYDASWVSGGVMQPLPVISNAAKGFGKVYVQYRAWLSNAISGISGIDDVASIDTIPGPLHPDNPLKWGVFTALANANGTTVYYTAVSNPTSLAAWTDVLEQLIGVRHTYNLVPLTSNQTVIDLYVAHVNAQSSAEMGAFRAVWISLDPMPIVPLVSTGKPQIQGYANPTTSDGLVALATLTDVGLAGTGRYRTLTSTSDNVDFLTMNIRPGDIVRTGFTTDGFGAEVYSEYVVESVQTADQLLLVSGPSGAVTVGSRYEIWRKLSANDEADAIARNAGRYANRRVRAVWPDEINTGSMVVDGIFVTSALAGLAAGVLPHQGLTRMPISGFAGVPRTTAKFNRVQLDRMASSGVWIVTQNDAGTVYTRHALTTAAGSDIAQREEMMVRNLDSISFRMLDASEPFVGISNMTDTLERRLRLELNKQLDLLSFEINDPDIGPQLNSSEIVEFRPHLTLSDRYVITINLGLPAPYNGSQIYLVV